ncbi:MAG TPA: nuclease-related domain-containing protein [Pirellulales bacterium]|nr:nuclease-related domain-containing protein [Pirellulales bacterium]
MGKNRFIPAEIPLAVRNNPRFRAELLVYDELKAQLDLTQRDWTVVYQAKWLLKEPSQEEPKEGEADFLLAHRKRGVLAVEVKGGLISFRDGQWYSRDRHGVGHPIDPFGQVARNARHLAKKLNELPQGIVGGGTFGSAFAKGESAPTGSVSRRRQERLELYDDDGTRY